MSCDDCRKHQADAAGMRGALESEEVLSRGFTSEAELVKHRLEADRLRLAALSSETGKGILAEMETLRDRLPSLLGHRDALQKANDALKAECDQLRATVSALQPQEMERVLDERDALRAELEQARKNTSVDLTHAALIAEGNIAHTITEAVADEREACAKALEAAADDADSRADKWESRGSCEMARIKAEEASHLRDAAKLVRARGQEKQAEPVCEKCNGRRFFRSGISDEMVPCPRCAVGGGK